MDDAEKIDLNVYIEKTLNDLLNMRAGIIEQHNLRELAEMFKHHAMMKGKALRPSLCRLVCESLGGNAREAMNYSIGVEFLHSATLVHDDIVDREYVRRGVTSVHEAFGIGKGLLLGDVMAALAYDVVLSGGLAHAALAGSKFSNAVFLISRGALIEHTDIMFTEEGYLQMLELKTAVLYALASELGAIASNANPSLREMCSRLGTNVGMAFQVMDDVVDVVKSVKLGKPVGDVTEGKLSLPMIYLYNKDSSFSAAVKDYANLRYVGKSADVTKMPEHEIMAFLNDLYDSDALQYSDDKINEYIVESQKCLMEFPDNKYTAALFDFTEYACKALKKEIDSVKAV